ncbi:glycine zipper 2TM domain-containing protein [Nitrosomonas sp.]|uniref:glycine zipper 2TM domain-containing protein n=1 Tax=Nitrosomonas sp. TaxID=42353 RepID=UPI00374D7DBE
MKTIRRFSFATLVIVVILSLNGCAGMSARDRNTAIGAGAGAGVGAVGGAALTGGSALGTVGGAAVGGVVGHEVGKGKK